MEEMTNECEVKVVTDAKFNLAERTAKFGEATIQFVMPVKRNAVSSPLISQLVRASTSIGANYCEADEAGSKKEFKYRISLCKRETRETKYWLRMLVAACPETKLNARDLWKEADELNRIFSSILRKANKNDQKMSD